LSYIYKYILVNDYLHIYNVAVACDEHY